ncbi:hypothetical protein [Labrys wisconsinensis]|uniref:Uncharacterized protein n=1 Tax=Labrys wisconsinensis TaxID=425677 RepID=A0ABU0JMF7_9HYPH|nr:hypothetical protein [Labrys wisconsinensis]MDQ0475480.1 hypothetical protein [Labrys wisconsinensis]
MTISKGVKEFLELARTGANVEVDAAPYTAVQLKSIAKELRDGAHMRIINTHDKTAIELAGVAQAKPGQIIFA